jgi:hypothetical protein
MIYYIFVEKSKFVTYKYIKVYLNKKCKINPNILFWIKDDILNLYFKNSLKVNKS